MKTAVICLGALMFTVGSALAGAQSQAPSGRGSVTGDPAASSADPSTSPTTGSATRPSRSGSGMSTSGGRDANGDQGRDKMPETANRPTIPLDRQNKPSEGR
jgi:hypothetical protein